MDCLIHDQSLNGQYSNPSDFLAVLVQLMRLQIEHSVIKQGLRCSRTIGDRPVTSISNFSEILRSWNNRDLRNLALKWIQSQGPFWEDERQVVNDDYFECLGHDVTISGAGEAARRVSKNLAVTLYSFENGGFDFSPLIVQQGLTETPVGFFEIPNFWTLQDLKNAALQAAPKIQNWEQMIDSARTQFPRLLFADDIVNPLLREPFALVLVERIFELLGTLHDFVESRDANGHYSLKTQELIANHFAGSKAWFTDESITNKRNFKETLTFNDPINPATKLFCPWHGKIKTPQFRIHFPWPLESSETHLKVVYIGPKLTKT